MRVSLVRKTTKPAKKWNCSKYPAQWGTKHSYEKWQARPIIQASNCRSTFSNIVSQIELKILTTSEVTISKSPSFIVRASSVSVTRNVNLTASPPVAILCNYNTSEHLNSYSLRSESALETLFWCLDSYYQFYSMLYSSVYNKNVITCSEASSARLYKSDLFSNQQVSSLVYVTHIDVKRRHNRARYLIFMNPCIVVWISRNNQ